MMRFRFLNRLWRDQRGVAALEFAIVAPILIAFYLAMTEICQGYMAQKRMSHVASMVADLVSQQSTLNTAEVDDIFGIGTLIMKPFSTAPLKQQVSSVTLINGVATVNWSRGSGMNGRVTGSTVTLPADLITNGESVIMAEVTYDYDSPVDYLMPGITKFSANYYLRPRQSNQTLCSNCPPVTA